MNSPVRSTAESLSDFTCSTDWATRGIYWLPHATFTLSDSLVPRNVRGAWNGCTM
jgi:hypothetical protein